MFDQYFYFIGITIFLPIWLLLFFKKERQKDMLFVGTILGIGAVLIQHFYAKFDYWNPPYLFQTFPFEDFYYGFIFGGISAEFYELVINKQNKLKKRPQKHTKLILVFALITALSFLILVDLLRINSIVAHIIPPLIVGIITGVIRKDLFIYAIFNGLFLVILTIVMFSVLLIIEPDLFIKYWYTNNLLGIYIFNIPVEELFFAFAVGFGAGNLYEVIFGD